MDIRVKLTELQRTAEQLELTAAQREEQLGKIARYTENFLEELETRRVYQQRKPGEQAPFDFSEQPAALDEALALLHEHVDSAGFNIGASGFLAFIPSGGLYPSALADFIAAVTNRYAGVQFAAPGVARMERSLVRWLTEVIGYPSSADGDLTSGGSIAALSAIVAAREAYEIRGRDLQKFVVYVTPLTHHTFLKALRIAGLQECPMRTVPLDENYRMDVQALENTIATDRTSGLTPWIVAATAGTTDMGTIDRLEDVASICERHRLWMYVDAAYGGAFMLCEEGRKRLEGIERSSSVIMDPHKGFFLPFGSGVVLVRDGAQLYRAFHARGTYMQDLKTDPREARSACDVSPELTRPFRGLRLWLPLKLAGIAPFRAALEEKLLLAEYFYSRIRELDGFVTGPHPDLSIVTFRYRPKTGDADEFNRKLALALRDDGRVFLSTTTLDGKFILRMAVLAYNTHMDAVDRTLELIQEKTQELLAG
ncbi:MAG: pyridoxal phosphate-dependent decarboxylase family protein [Pseudomonadales bacterium]